MEHIKKNMKSRKITNIMPHIVTVLEQYEERIKSLELLNQSPPPVVPDEIINEKEHIIQPEIVNPIIAELTSKMSQLANDSVILNDEIETLDNLENEEDDIDDNQSVCTDVCREILTDAELIQAGRWKVDAEMCNGCVKVNAKSYQKEKVKNEKARAKQLKAVKEKQKELIKLDQAALATRLKNLKKGRPEDYGIDNDKQQQMKEELQRLADAYQKGEKTDSQFRIQMFL
jgi:hypothetical protein